MTISNRDRLLAAKAKKEGGRTILKMRFPEELDWTVERDSRQRVRFVFR